MQSFFDRSIFCVDIFGIWELLSLKKTAKNKFGALKYNLARFYPTYRKSLTGNIPRNYIFVRIYQLI